MHDTMRNRVFAIAFSCEPGRGSEPGVGYHFAEALARLSLEGDYQIALLTRAHTSKAVEHELARVVGMHNMEIIPIPLPMWLVCVTRRRFVRFAYMAWQIAAVRLIQKVTAGSIHPYVVHHITFATDGVPSFENMLGEGARRIFGPAGSSQEIIEAEGISLKARIRRKVRRLFGKTNIRNVDLAIASNDSVAKIYSSYIARSVLVEPNIVVSSDAVCQAMQSTASMEGRGHELIYVGRLEPVKRIHIALEAFSLLKNQQLHLSIVGEGPTEGALRELCAKLRIEQRVSFVGSLPREDTLALIAQARVLVNPSMNEGSSWVVGEAQSVGTVPVVCRGSGMESTVRLGGFGVVVGSSSAAALADGIETALDAQVHPTERWNGDRLPFLLRDWYQQVLTRQ